MPIKAACSGGGGLLSSELGGGSFSWAAGFLSSLATNDDQMMRYLNYEQMAMLVYLYRLVISEWSDASRSTFEQAGSHASLVEWSSDSVTR